MQPLSRRISLCLSLLVMIAWWMSPLGHAGQESLPLAIKGYDPVAYFAQGKPVIGSPQFEYVWDERRYRFANAEHRNLFKADPVHYAPQFANFCAMALARGEVHEANPEYWLISGDKLYLFSLPVGPSRFQQALNENVYKADRNRGLIEKH